jgi:hypothetical protein
MALESKPLFRAEVTWVGEVKRIRGKKQPLTAAGLQGLREEYTRTIAPARALAAETLKLEHTLSHLVNQASRKDNSPRWRDCQPFCVPSQRQFVSRSLEPSENVPHE